MWPGARSISGSVSSWDVRVHRLLLCDSKANPSRTGKTHSLSSFLVHLLCELGALKWGTEAHLNAKEASLWTQRTPVTKLPMAASHSLAGFSQPTLPYRARCLNSRYCSFKANQCFQGLRSIMSATCHVSPLTAHTTPCNWIEEDTHTCIKLLSSSKC